jgi:hypothetical protein
LPLPPEYKSCFPPHVSFLLLHWERHRSGPTLWLLSSMAAMPY